MNEENNKNNLETENLNQPNANKQSNNNQEKEPEKELTPLQKILYNIVFPFIFGLALIIWEGFSIAETQKYTPVILLAGFILTYKAIASLITFSKRYTMDYKPYKILYYVIYGIFIVGSLVACGFFVESKTWDIIWDIIYLSIILTTLTASIRFIFNLKNDETTEHIKTYNDDYEEFEKQKNAKILYIALSVISIIATIVTSYLYISYKTGFSIIDMKNEMEYVKDDKEEKILEELFEHKIVPIYFYKDLDEKNGNEKITIGIFEYELKRTDKYDPFIKNEEDDEYDDDIYYNLFYVDLEEIITHVASANKNDVIQSFTYFPDDDENSYVFTKTELKKYDISKNYLKEHKPNHSKYFSNFIINDEDYYESFSEESLSLYWYLLHPKYDEGYYIHTTSDFIVEQLKKLVENNLVDLDLNSIDEDYLIDLIYDNYLENTDFIVTEGNELLEYLKENNNDLNEGLIEYNPDNEIYIYFTYDYLNEKLGIK